MRVNLVFASDDNYAPYLAVAIRSAVEKKAKNNFYKIVVLDGGISRHRQKLLKETVVGFENIELEILKIPLEKFQGVKGFLHLTSAAYLRLIIPEILPNEIKRVIYCDCDLLIKNDLKELMKMDLKGNKMAAVEVFHPNYSWGLHELNQNLPQNAYVFNTGVLVMDVEALRNDNFTQKMLKEVKQNSGRYLAADQDALILFYYHQTKKLAPQWNVTSYLYMARNAHECGLSESERRQVIKDAKIVHFDGAKPWQAGYFHPEVKIWRKIYLRTAFAYDEIEQKKQKSDKIIEWFKNATFSGGWLLVNKLPEKLYMIIFNWYLSNNFIVKRVTEIKQKEY